MNNTKFSRLLTISPIFLLLIWIFFSFLLVAIGTSKAKTPLLQPGAWVNSDNFAQEIPDRLNSHLTDQLINKGAQLFTNQSRPSWHTFAGKIESYPFKPAQNMVIPIKAGVYSGGTYARSFSPTEASVNLNCLNNGKIKKLLASPAQDWFELSVKIPDDWCNGDVTLTAESLSKDVFAGVGTPFSVSRIYTLLAGPLNYFVAFGISSILFLSLFLPPLFLTRFQPLIRGALSLLQLGAFGYISFILQAQNFSYRFSLFITLLILLSPLAFLIYDTSLGQAKKIIPPLSRLCLIWLILGLFICLPVSILPMSSGAWNFNFAFYPVSWSTDNLLSPSMASYVFETDGVQPPGIGPWSVIDRGFIPAGLISGQMLLLKFSRLLSDVPNKYALAQMIVSLGNASILLLLINFRKVREESSFNVIKMCIVFCATPFIFFNIVYAWPKLSAGIFFLWALLILVKTVNENSLKLIWLTPPLLAMGILFHSGIVFLIPGILIYLIYNYRNISWSFKISKALTKDIALIILSTSIALLILQHHDSYGKKTSYGLTFLLFGSGQFGLTFNDIYNQLKELLQNLSLEAFVSLKFQQVFTLIWPPFPEIFYENYWISRLRLSQFYSALPAILFFTPISFLLINRRSHDLTDSIQTNLFTIFLISTFSTFILLFITRFPFIVHHLPYTWLLSLVLIAMLRADYRSSKINALVAAHFFLFLYTWIWLPSRFWTLRIFSPLS